MMFIHIPKNAGSTIEQLLSKNQSIISRHKERIPGNFMSPSSGWRSPWHMPPDLYEAIYKRKFNTRGFHRRMCIVRNPLERYASCQAWSRNVWHTSMSELASVYSSNWSSVTWNEELLHRMPQHMFVFARTGDVQCDCIVAIEKLKNYTSVHKNSAKHFNSIVPVGFESLYAADYLLWKEALRNPEVCHSVPPFPNRRHART